jgi:flagellar biosynthesis/type III secretory pathway M-ring protein FliF/YscJ
VRKGEGDSGAEQASGGDETETQSTEKGVAGTRKTVEDAPAGDIQRITVAVRIPVEEGAALAEARRQLPELREVIRNAAGPQARAEDIAIQIFPTRKPEAVVAAVTEADRVALWLSSNWLKIVVGALALVGFFVLVRVIQTNTAKDSVEELEALTTALSETREAHAELALPGEGDVARLKQGIQEMVGRNPQGVASSLKSFMSGR